MKRVRLFAVAMCLFALWQFPSITMASAPDDCTGPNCLVAKQTEEPQRLPVGTGGVAVRPPVAPRLKIPLIRAAVHRGHEAAQHVVEFVRHPRRRCR